MQALGGAGGAGERGGRDWRRRAVAYFAHRFLLFGLVIRVSGSGDQSFFRYTVGVAPQ